MIPNVDKSSSIHSLGIEFSFQKHPQKVGEQDRNAYVRAIAVDVIIRVANAETAQNLIERM